MFRTGKETLNHKALIEEGPASSTARAWPFQKNSLHTKGAEFPTTHKPFSTTNTKRPTLDSMLFASILVKLVGFPGRESHPTHCRHHKRECSTELRASREELLLQALPHSVHQVWRLCKPVFPAELLLCQGFTPICHLFVRDRNGFRGSGFSQVPRIS